MHYFRIPRTARSALLAVSLSPFILPLAGCLDGSSDSDDDEEVSSRTGVFVDSAVAGLDYRGEKTGAGMTNQRGEFSYVDGERLTFSIGELELGSATGSEVLTPLSIVEGATAAEDQRVSNMLVLLQSLDADGNLNNGIQLSEPIRDEVSLTAGSLHLDQSFENFSAALVPLLARLEAADAFSDTDPRPRKAAAVTDALEHFARSTSPRKVVETTSGQLRGFEADESAWQFLGVPYAQPPLGDLRWKAPQPINPWEGIREAVSWSDQAAQSPALERFGEGGMSEDSLYLNVTAPKDGDNLPVMVWFHGGGFSSLSGSSPMYDGVRLCQRGDVVVVTLNHRLNLFGFAIMRWDYAGPLSRANRSGYWRWSIGPAF